MRNLEAVFALPTASLQSPHGSTQALHPVHEHGRLTFEMVGEEHEWSTRRHRNGGDPRAHALDGEMDARAEDLAEVAQVPLDVGTRVIEMKSSDRNGSRSGWSRFLLEAAVIAWRTWQRP